MSGEGSEKHRIITVDFSKGVALFAIVLLHALYCQPGGTNESITSSPPIDFAYAGLFLFFIFSGYFFRPERSAKANILRRVKQLTVVSSFCLLVLPLINLVYFRALGMDVGFDDYLDSLWLLIGGDNVFDDVNSAMSQRALLGTYPAYYYVQVMIVAFLIFYPLAEKVMADLRRLIAVTILLLAVTVVLVEVVALKLPFYAQLAPLAAAFMFLGAYLRRFNIMEYLEDGWRTREYWTRFIVIFIVMCVLLVCIPPGHSFDKTVFGDYGGYSVFPFYVTMAVCCYVLLVLSSMVSKIHLLSKVFCTVGKHTLALLLFHAFFIKLLTVPFYHLDNSAWFPAMPTYAAVAAGIASVVIIVVLAELYPRLVGRLRHGPIKAADMNCGQ